MRIRLFFIFLLIFISACNDTEPVIVKRETTSDPVINEPELIEEETEKDDVQFIEFSLPYEQVVINLQKIPILKEYLQLMKDKKTAIEKMNLIPIHLGKRTIYLLEFSCEDSLCSYLIIDQSKDNPAYLIADLAKYVNAMISPDQTTIIIKFQRHHSLPVPLTNLVAIDLDQWKILSLTTSSATEHEILNFNWPISSITWIDETTISAHIPRLTELTEENLSEWKNSEKETAEIIFQIEK